MSEVSSGVSVSQIVLKLLNNTARVLTQLSLMSLPKGFQVGQICFTASTHAVLPTLFSPVQDVCSHLSRNSLLAFNLNAFFFFTIFQGCKSVHYHTQFIAFLAYCIVLSTTAHFRPHFNTSSPSQSFRITAARTQKFSLHP